MTLFSYRHVSAALARISGARAVTIIMYHSICEEPDTYAVSPAAFARHMDFLRRNYSILRLTDVPSELEREDRSARQSVVITFDDAFSDFLTFAYPILKANSMPCTVFVPTAFIGRTNDWDAGKGPVRSIMGSGDIIRLHEEGLVDFGSHTVDHVRMARIPEEEMYRQAIESKQQLEALLGTPVRMFAYPYGQLGDFSSVTTKVLAEAGYEIAVTTHWGTRNSFDEMLRLRRIYFQESDDHDTLRSKLQGASDWLAGKEKAAFAYRRLSLPGTHP